MCFVRKRKGRKIHRVTTAAPTATGGKRKDRRDTAIPPYKIAAARGRSTTLARRPINEMLPEVNRSRGAMARLTATETPRACATFPLADPRMGSFG